MSIQSRMTSVLALTLVAASIQTAQAETASSSFDSRVQVVATCSIAAADLTFQTITTGTTSNIDASSTLSVNCSNGAVYAVSLSNGANFDTTRRMAWGGSYIGYALYSDVNRALEWNTTNTLNRTGTGTAQIHTVYGRIPAGQAVPNMGSYADTIVATVSY